MSDKSYNDISYKKSQSDRLHELLNQKAFNSKKCNGSVPVESSKSEISDKDILCNTEEESVNYSKKQGMCYTVDGKKTSILQTSNAISSSENVRNIKMNIKQHCCE